MYSRPKKTVGKDDFVWVKSVYGKGPDAKKRFEFIVPGGMNKVIADWQYKQPDHPRDHATPSTLTTCPRVAWLLNHDVAPTNEMTWAVKQRMLLGRLFENQFAEQLKDEGMLLKHWKDDPGVAVEKFAMGEGIDFMDGVPDYLLMLRQLEQGEIVAVSDAKTSRSDSFGYTPIDDVEIFTEWNWYKYRLQLTAYYMLCHANKQWFEFNPTRTPETLPLPTHCHLFSYALDDGVVRREVLWTPTQEDMLEVKRYIRRYNNAVASPTMPECLCHESYDQFDVKFCRFGQVEAGKKIADRCCSDSLIERIKV